MGPPLARKRVAHRAGVRPREALALRRAPLRAPAAASARRKPREHDAVARRDVGHAGADRLDHAGALVAEDRRERRRVHALRRVQVGVADAGRGVAHQHLAGARRLELDLLHAERRAERAQHGRPDDAGAAAQWATAREPPAAASRCSSAR
jgi:hypothetical protein